MNHFPRFRPFAGGGGAEEEHRSGGLYVERIEEVNRPKSRYAPRWTGGGGFDPPEAQEATTLSRYRQVLFYGWKYGLNEVSLQP